MQHVVCITELTKTLAKLEDRMVKRERIIEEKGNEIEKLQKVIQHLEAVSNFSLFQCCMFYGILSSKRLMHCLTCIYK
jgi:CII-binding regulator of phage lambda lysogenization HflD